MESSQVILIAIIPPLLLVVSQYFNCRYKYISWQKSHQFRNKNQQTKRRNKRLQNPICGLTESSVKIYRSDHFKERSIQRYQQEMKPKSIYKLLKNGTWKHRDKGREKGKRENIYKVEHIPSNTAIILSLDTISKHKAVIIAITTYPIHRKKWQK